ncbi:MAG: hypothetical protein HGGPFJEG_03044 [Ignavibacteria bacterium]|nr:hypothetical protein [Ignavibacteria bacterium]
MEQFKLKKKPVMIFFITFLVYSLSCISNLKADVPEYVNGKVIYSDSKIPVNGGIIRVIRVDEINGEEVLIESTVIQQNGTFKLLKETIQQTDGVKIMAYPNDYDNGENDFEPKDSDLKNALESNDKEFSIIISVDKANVKNQTGDKEIPNELQEITAKNFPNPFNPVTMISFNLPEASLVSVKVFNINGETVATLAENQFMKTGNNEMYFNAGDLPSGIYIYNLNAGGYATTGKMTLLK